MSMTKIPTKVLLEMFNNVLNSYPFVICIPTLDEIFGESKHKSYKEDDSFNKYLNKKQMDIECKLDVFENIPATGIYYVIESFINALMDYNRSIIYKKENTKKFQKESYNLRKKDIKIIKAYQEMIFDYTSDNDWNDDEAYSILNPVLNDIYHTNKELLHELETKKYQVLDGYRYGGTNLYDSTKKPIKRFFAKLQEEYPLKTNDIKQMVDIL